MGEAMTVTSNTFIWHFEAIMLHIKKIILSESLCFKKGEDHLKVETASK